MTDKTPLAQHQLLGLYDSPFVRRVAVTMRSYGIPFEHLSLSVFRHMEAMQPLNPLFKVPMLILPDGEKMYESAYLLDYLDELATARGLTPLTPQSGKPRRRVQQLMALAMIGAEKAVAIAYEGRRPTELAWPKWIERVRAQMRTAWGMLEAQMDGDHLVGDCLTQADISAVAGIGFIRHTLPREWPAGTWPRLESLAARLEASPAFMAVPIDE